MDGGTLSGVLFIVFLVLKLTHHITWSWWWVTSPLWISAAAGVLVFGTCLAFGFSVLGFLKRRGGI
jgi:hypothetical protein